MKTSAQEWPGFKCLLSIDWNDSFMKRTWGGWKRAIVGSFSAIIFGAAILVMSILAVSNPMGVSPSEMGASSSGIQEIKYYLPYPGILPDSPLYKLKAARDRIMLWLTWDEGKKAERELLYADKRINAAQVLAEGGKVQLGVTTATKAEKYLATAAERTIGMSKKGKDVKSFMNTLKQATKRHIEMLSELINRTNGGEKAVVEKTLDSTLMVEQNIDQALLEAK